jgi:hypothetical protein
MVDGRCSRHLDVAAHPIEVSEGWCNHDRVDARGTARGKWQDKANKSKHFKAVTTEHNLASKHFWLAAPVKLRGEAAYSIHRPGAGPMIVEPKFPRKHLCSRRTKSVIVTLHSGRQADG